MRISHIPPRLATGAFILNSGLTKLNADDDTAKNLRSMAAGAFPAFGDVEPQTFAKTLALGEITLGSALMAPFVPSWLAGSALTAFSGGLVRMYLRTPGMTQEDGVRPTQKGTPFAKDIWMLGTGLGLVLDSITTPRRRKTKRHTAHRVSARRQPVRALSKGA